MSNIDENLLAYYTNIEFIESKNFLLFCEKEPIGYAKLFEDKEYSLPIDKGKSLIVRYLEKGEPNANGSSSVFFELNGQPRTIEIQNTEFSKNISVKIKLRFVISTSDNLVSPEP